jgi:hypothetical protein
MLTKDTRTGEYVITEVTSTRSSEVVDKSKVSSSTRTVKTEDGTEIEARQMEDLWIEDAFQKEIIDQGIDVPEDLKIAIRSESVPSRKEAIVVQDGSVSRTITDGVTDFGYDDITIVRTGGVTQ